MTKREFTVLIEQDEEGWFVAKVPALRGCFTQGKTAEEAKERVQEAIALWIESFGVPEESPTRLVEVQSIQVAV